MGFWLFMLAVSLLIPLTMIFLGRYFLIHSPGNIAGLCGYRTRMSTKNKDTWDFAHRYAGRLWLIWGCVLLPLTLVPMLLVRGADANTVGAWGGIITLVQAIPFIGVILPTEKALHRAFDEDGSRR